ncbi:MAG: lamin tail domain-containing protein [Verrucomicrobiales bacterium]
MNGIPSSISICVLLGSLAASAPKGAAQGEPIFVINELDADQPGTDAAEFIELYDGGAGNSSLDGWFLVLFNGSVNTSYRTLDLSGYQTNANGYFVVGSPGMESFAGIILTQTSGWLQNGSDSTGAAEGDAVALFKGNPADVPAGTSVAELPDTVILWDAVVYDGGAALSGDDVELLNGLRLTGQSMKHDPSTGSLGRTPDGGDGFEMVIFQTINPPTPGGANAPNVGLTLQLSVNTVAENAGSGAVIGTITRTGPTDESLDVTITNNDPTEASMPIAAQIAVGQTSTSFPIDIVNDTFPDGTQFAVIRVSASGYTPGSQSLQVTDEGDPAGLVVNEFHATGVGDTNGDGSNQTRGFDEFIELVNAGTSSIDLSGFKVFDSAGLADSAQVRHIFPAGTVLPAGCALLLFGGGGVAEGIGAQFGNAWVQKANGANEFGLGLNDAGDIISIRDLANVDVAGATYGAIGGEDSIPSQNLNPDLTGTGYVLHSSAPGSGGNPYSPGTRTNLGPFCSVSQSLVVSADPASIIESAGTNAATLTITRPAPLSGALTVAISSNDPTEAVPAQSVAVIPAGQASISVPINAVNDTAEDGTQTVTFNVTGTGFLTTGDTLEVQDDGDLPLETLFINEIDSDQAGNDTGEFIELYDGGIGNRSLDGFIVVLFNGNINDASYLTIDLAGKSTNAQGFFVIGSSGVPNVGFPISSDILQNGADAVAIYKDAAANFPNNTAATATNLFDAVVYGTADPEDTGLTGVLTPGKPQADEGASNNTEALARRPDATTAFAPAAFVAQTPTPGATNVISLTGYDAWAAGFPGLGARTVDSDGDGIINVLEYALGGNPLEADVSVLPQVSIGPGGKPRITVGKGVGAASDTSLAFQIEASTTLAAGSWSATDVTVVSDDATSLVADYAGSAPTAFLRLKVILSPGP